MPSGLVLLRILLRYHKKKKKKRRLFYPVSYSHTRKSRKPLTLFLQQKGSDSM